MTDSVADAIVVDGLVKRYGTRAAVDGLSFRVQAGTVFALLGTNGAGKTTTVEMLEGYRRPDAGSVRVLGLDPIADSRSLKGRTGLMLQSGGIPNGAKVGELVALFCAFYPNPADPDALIDLVGLSDERRKPFKRLSGGQQRRLALAVALAGNPEVVFLDEPTAGMDPVARQVTYGIVRDLRAKGTTIVLTTHLLDEAESLADSVAIVDRGRLVAQGTPAELMSGGGLRFGANGIDAATLPSALGTIDELRPGHFVAHVTPNPALVATLATWAASHGVLLDYISAGARSLEDVFLELIEEGTE